jgi:DDE family transposase
MIDCTQQKLEIPGIDKRPIEIEFSGGDVTSDGGGCLLLRMVDKALGLIKKVAAILPDKRDPDRIEHSTEEMLRQRVFGIALGYEDCNDHNELRNEPGFQIAVGKEEPLASQSTLQRFENTMNQKVAWKMHETFVETFIASFKTAPKELILDFDATDDLVHGSQEGAFFHGYYDNYCFLPLYVFCGGQLLVSYLRSSKRDGSLHTWGILSLLVKRLRKEWPHVKITFRGDGGFCRHQMFNWCERKNVDYIVGLTGNQVLNRMAASEIEQAKTTFETPKENQRIFTEFQYGAKSWKKERRVIVKAEHNAEGPNTRYVVTNIQGSTAQEIYDTVYCARGEMENRIKEQQLHLFADRTSCSKWWANQFRLLLSSLAYIYLETMRRIGLEGTRFARAQCHTIRLKLFKIGGIILRNTRRIRFLLSSNYVYKEAFLTLAQKLSTA